ncbi:MAG: SRPBCC domain-containing protein [Propionibacterium sp.]
MGRTDRARLLIHRDRAEVFAALVDQQALLRWLPPRGMQGRFLGFDMREGGSYRLELRYLDASGAPGKSSADSDVSEVHILRIVPGERIVQEVRFESTDPSLEATMQMEWSLHSSDAGTDVEIVARDVPDGIRASEHAAGITSSLANLAGYLEP